MAVTQYIGARYVPVFATPLEWTNDRAYEPLTIVEYNGNSYTSMQSVPKGTDILNGDYWVATGNYNAQVEAYRKEVQTFEKEIDTAVSDAAAAKQAAAQASTDVSAVSTAVNTAQTRADAAYTLADTANRAAATETARAEKVENTAIKSLTISNNTLTSTTIGGTTITVGSVGSDSDFLHAHGILCLGDSFGSENDKISGRGYWPAYLRTQIQNETGITNLPFYNYCVSGYGFNNAAATANDTTALSCTYTNAHSFYQAAVTAASTLKSTSYNGKNVAANIGHVIIYGGYNDIDRMPDIVKDTTLGNQLKAVWKSNITTTIEYIHQQFPRAFIHIIPFNWPSKAVSSLRLKYMVEQVAKASYDSRLNIYSYYSPLCEVAGTYQYCGVTPYAWTWLLGQSEYISSDALHPNAAGAKVIATYINDVLHGTTPLVSREIYASIGESYGIYLTLNGNTVSALLSTQISAYQQPTLPEWCLASRSVSLFGYIGSIPGAISVIRPAMFFFDSGEEAFKTWDSSTTGDFVTGENYGMCYFTGSWQVG